MHENFEKLKEIKRYLNICTYHTQNFQWAPTDSIDTIQKKYFFFG